MQKIRLCGCFILQLALSLDGPYPRKMSEKRGEVIVPAGRRYQQKQHELLPAAKGLNSKTTPTVVRFLVSSLYGTRGNGSVEVFAGQVPGPGGRVVRGWSLFAVVQPETADRTRASPY